MKTRIIFVFLLVGTVFFSGQAIAMTGKYTMNQYQNGRTAIGNLTVSPPIDVKGVKTWPYVLETYCARYNPRTGDWDLITGTKTGVITQVGGVKGVGSIHGYVGKDGSTGRIFGDMTWQGNDPAVGTAGGHLGSGHIKPDPYDPSIPECP